MWCKCGKPIENRDTGLCASCAKLQRKAEQTAAKDANNLAIKLLKQQKKNSLPRKSVSKVSAKRKAENPVYSARRVIFLEGKQCAVYPDLKATEIHHQAGRRGYIDQYAYENKISAFLDERYWLAVSEAGHIKIEADTIWAKDKGFSIVRSVPIKQTI